MYKTPPKGKQVRRLILIYTLMITAIITLVAVLVLIMLGYRFNQEDQRFEQTGLVQFDSTPASATVEIDKKRLAAKSATKSVVTPGAHEFAMWREGYETWWKQLTIRAGTVTWLDYARLVPKERPVEAVLKFERLDDVLFSPAGEYVLVHPVEELPEFTLVDLRDEDNVKQQSVVLSQDIITKAADENVSHSYVIKEWDQSGRYVLVAHTFGDEKEWLLIDTESPEQTKNISSIVRLPIESAQIAGTSGDRVYILANETIRLANLSDGTLSRAYATNVKKFSVYGTDIITYIGTSSEDSAEHVVGIVREDDTQPHILRTVQAGNDAALSIATARYYNQNYVAIAIDDTIEILSGDYPTGEKEKEVLMTAFGGFTFPRPVQWLQISDNGRFIVAQDSKGYMSYDLERKTVSEVIEFATPQERQLRWLDNYNVWTNDSGQIVMREFDGANQHALMPAEANFGASFSNDSQYLYSIGVTEGGFNLQRIRMILEQ